MVKVSNEDYDTGRKLMFYMQIESLKQYIIVDSTRIHIRVVTRREQGTRQFSEFTSTEDKVFVELIGFEISATDLYERVQF